MDTSESQSPLIIKSRAPTLCALKALSPFHMMQHIRGNGNKTQLETERKDEKWDFMALDTRMMQNPFLT